MLACENIIPSNDWYHFPTLTTYYDNTVEYYLEEYKTTVPDEWKTNKIK